MKTVSYEMEQIVLAPTVEQLTAEEIARLEAAIARQFALLERDVTLAGMFGLRVDAETWPPLRRTSDGSAFSPMIRLDVP